MQRRSLICVFLLTAYCLLNLTAATAQVTDTTKKPVTDTTKVPVTDSIKAITKDTTGISVDPDLIALSNSKNPPREYTIAGIKITGTK